MKSLINNYSQSLGFEPEKITYTLNNVYLTTAYTWAKNKKRIQIVSMIYDYRKKVDFHVHEMIGVE